ncbi:MAG: hypothetical protein OEQ39_27895 [Gammaproteobacteria bacterium]|nr:hypothetical protein [Gammaproteobacteria bacterium]
MREKMFLIADTETIGTDGKAIVFDLAYVIATRKRIILERSFIIREIITNPRAMFSAIANNFWRESFGKKLFTHYIPGLASQDLQLFGWRDATEILRDDMQTHNVKVFSAFNLNFDIGALGKTQLFIMDGGKVLPYKPDFLCLWQFACETVCQTNLYHDVAQAQGKESGWITEAGNIRTNAEKVYAFLTGDLNFVESHTALEDAQIETEILQRLLARKKPIPYNRINHMPWKLAQPVHGQRSFWRKRNVR